MYVYTIVTVGKRSVSGLRSGNMIIGILPKDRNLPNVTLPFLTKWFGCMHVCLVRVSPLMLPLKETTKILGVNLTPPNKQLTPPSVNNFRFRQIYLNGRETKVVAVRPTQFCSARARFLSTKKYSKGVY